MPGKKAVMLTKKVQWIHKALYRLHQINCYLTLTLSPTIHCDSRCVSKSPVKNVHATMARTHVVMIIAWIISFH